MTAQVLGRDKTNGVILGQSGGKVGFFGEAGVTQPTVTGIGTTTISQVGTTGKWAFATSTAALAFVARVQSLQDKLNALGLINEG
jgi:hypothetical protein